MNRIFQKSILIVTCCLLYISVSAQTSSLVYDEGTGKLVYKADAKGNTVPDFSGVGYMNSEALIPEVPVVKTVQPLSGDNLVNIQNAINEVSALPLQSNGFRGAILFKRGRYEISNTVTLSASGIVLKGEGSDEEGTVFVATRTTQFNLIRIAGNSGVSANETTAKKVTDAYVPCGINHVTVESGHSFQAGDWVYLRRVPNQAWIDLLNTGQYGWTPSGYKVNYERQITKVDGNTIYLDAPVADYIEPAYAQGYLVKITLNRIQNCGIEDIRFISTYASADDENHGWIAVQFDKIYNGWARNLEAYYFGYSAVSLGEQARWVTVDNCKMLDPMSQTTGGRKYSFNNDGQRNLVKNCVTRGGRHDYVQGSCTAGPNVFYSSSSTQTHADIGPHHRWSTGVLFDNIVSDGSMNVQNRTNSGSGHGWAGAQTMFWNCSGPEMIVQDPPGDHVNWAIGCVGKVTNVGDWVTEPAGIVESNGTHVTPSSLFEAQLKDRLTTSIPLFSPLNLKADASSDQIKLSWVDDSYSEQLFRIERSEDYGATWNSLATVQPEVETFVNTGITDTITHYYRVRAENASGNSAYSNVAKASCRLDPLPPPWKNQDLGSPAAAGVSNFVNGTFVINGSGTDIWSSADEGQFVYQTLEGNAEVVARVASVANTNSWAKAGVMIRQNADSNSPNAFMLISAASGTSFQYRTSLGGSSSSVRLAGMPPVWIKLVREGNTFTGYQSSEGSIWTKVGSVTIPMTSSIFIGMAVSSHVSGTLCTAKFDHVSVKSNPTTDVNQYELREKELIVFPNPVKKHSTVRYLVQSRGDIDLSLIGTDGKVVKELFHGTQEQGEYQCNLETDNLRAGVYVLRLKQNHLILQKKIVVTN